MIMLTGAASKQSQSSTDQLANKALRAMDYLKHDRKRFLLLSLNKFSLPDTLDLCIENVKEITHDEDIWKANMNKEEGKRPQQQQQPQKDRTQFGTTLREYIAVATSEHMAQEMEDEKLVTATQQLLVNAYGQEYRTARPPLDGKSIEGRVLYLTNCLWRYLPLRKMTTYHLHALLKVMKQNDRGGEKGGKNGESTPQSIATQREIFPELVQALGSIVRDIEYDGNDLEHCSVVLQILAAMPEYGHGETAPKATVDISLEAITAFAQVPRVVEHTHDLMSKAAELAMLLEHGNAESVAFGTGGNGQDEDREETERLAFERMRALEEDGAAACATLLRQHLRSAMSDGTGTTMASPLAASSATPLESFTDQDIGARTSALMCLLSKMSHDTELMCSTSPIIFETILRAMQFHDGEVDLLSPADVSALSVILASLPKESDAYHLGSELLNSRLNHLSS